MARSKWITLSLLVATLYFAGTRFGLSLAMDANNASAVWPSAGIALGFVMLYGWRMLPAVFVSALWSNFYENVVVNDSGHLLLALGHALGVAAGSTCEPLLAVLIVLRFARPYPFSRLKFTLVYIGACCSGSLLSALIAAATLLTQWDAVYLLQFVATWWLGDMAALLVLTPLIVSCARSDTFRWGGYQQAHLLAYATCCLLTLSLWFAPTGYSGLSQAAIVLLIPILVWGALAFRTAEICLILLVVTALMLLDITLGADAGSTPGIQGTLIELQLIVCATAASILAMNAAFSMQRRQKMRQTVSVKRLQRNSEHRIAQLELHNRELQDQMLLAQQNAQRLQQSEEQLAVITKATSEGVWEWEPIVGKFRCSQRFHAMLGFNESSAAPTSVRFWLRQMEATDRMNFFQACRNHLRDRVPLNINVRMRYRSGQLRWYRIQAHATWNADARHVLLAGSLADVHEERVAHAILLTEKRLLERMTGGAHISEVLNLVTELLCARFIDGGCAISLIAETSLIPHLVAERKIPRSLHQFLLQQKVEPSAVGISAAIYFNSQIVVEDITRHDDWRQYLSVVRCMNIKACWAIPIRNRHGSVLGGMGLFFANTLYPSVEEAEFLDRVARLAGIAVEQDNIRNVLQTSEQQYRELYHNNPAMFFSLDADARILSVNQFGAEHLGYVPSQLVLRDYRDLIVAGSRQDVDCALQNALEQPGKVQVFEARTLRADGRKLWVRDSFRAMGGASGRLEVLVVAEDITDMHVLSDRLAYQAAHDSLTGLFNRRKFETELTSALSDVLTQKSRHALCYMDLDLFKVINDTCGHAAGDELLRQLGRLLEEIVAERAIIARLGGDEFGLLILHADQALVLQLASEIHERVTSYQFIWERRPYSIGVSIGIAMISEDLATLAAVMGAADSACYAAKEAGRNRVHVYREDDKELIRRRGEMQWVSLIPRGVRENRFALAIQEIVPLAVRDSNERHFELLLRYRNAESGWMEPHLFMPAAERYSLATLLDRWVFVQAAELLQQLTPRQRDACVFNVNLSGQSVGNEEFQSFVALQMQQLDLPRNCICFEITETAAIANLSRAQHFIENLKALGCRFALDDFGSGLSTFGYLKQLSVDYIKIDGQFVKDIETDDIDFAIVKSINEVGHVLGKQTIAEFVENEKIARKLQSIGVDWAQGYHLSVPMMLSEWLKRQAETGTVQLQKDKC